MKARTRDLLGSIFMFVFVVSLLVQRDFNTPLGAIFPDVVMGCVVLLIVITIALMFTPWSAINDDEESVQPAGGQWFDMIFVGALLLAWTVLLRPAGFIFTSFLGFTIISWFLNEKRNSLKGIILSTVVGAGMVGLLIFVFQYVLKVPLPKGTLFY